MTMALTQEKVVEAPGVTLAETVGYNTTAWQVAESMLRIAPGGGREAAFRDVVPVTPLTELAPEVLPERVRESSYRILVKCDNEMPGGAYKLRGVTSALLDVAEQNRASTEVAVASTGNHANETALAALALGFGGVHAYVPQHASPVKVFNIERNGAHPHTRATLEDCVEAAQRHGSRPNATFVHPYNQVEVMAGQGTAALEVAAQLADHGVDPAHDSVIEIVPAGGGGYAAGMAVGVRMAMPQAQVRVAQAENADAIVARVKGRAFNKESFNSACDGAAVPEPGELPMQILADKQLVQGADTVTRGEIGEAMATLGNAEPAGALALAAAFKFMQGNPDGSGVIVVHLSGANTTPEKVQEFMAYAYTDGLIDGPTAFAAVSRAYAERTIHGVDEVLLRAGASASKGCVVWSGATSTVPKARVAIPRRESARTVGSPPASRRSRVAI